MFCYFQTVLLNFSPDCSGNPFFGWRGCEGKKIEAKSGYTVNWRNSVPIQKI